MSDTAMSSPSPQQPITRYLQQVDNSYTINVPSVLARKCNLRKHSLIKFSTQENKLVLEGVQI